MTLGLTTIRRKLTVLVLIPVLVTLGALVGLERILERQLLGAAEQRVMASERALQIRLDDDLKALKLELLGLAESAPLRDALAAGDRAALADATAHFSESYAALALLVADSQGQVLSANAFEGITALDQLSVLNRPETEHSVAKSLAIDGCAGKGSGPARLLVARAGSAGEVVACQRLDEAFLNRAGLQLGMGLALIDARGATEPAGAPRVLAHTPGFPLRAPVALGETVLHREADELWAVAHFCPALFPDNGEPDNGERCVVDALSALPVGDLRATIRGDFMGAFVLLAAAGLLAVLWGGRMAVPMTRALERLVGGFRRLESQEYAPIEPVRTGDEIERLEEGFNAAVQGLAERDRLRSTFGKYMTESVMSHLMEGQVRLGGDTLPVTMLFSDIRGFTTLSERLDAQELVTLLNEYFTEMVDIVMDHGGVVDKYIGDAIMVVFGAPVPQDDDALRAVQAAVAMREALERLNARLEARGLAPIRTGIGIHSGEVVAGNIGSERRMEYTVIGDAVNLASRLEGATKELGADLVISEATYALVQDEVEAEALGTISVKGREQPVTVYVVNRLQSTQPSQVAGAQRVS